MSAPKATAEQLAALTVPATLPGVVRCGTPMQFPPSVGEVAPGVCFGAVNRLVFVVCTKFHDLYRFQSDDVVVDLTDATGRAHVAWAIAKAVGLALPDTAVMRPSSVTDVDLRCNPKPGVYPGGQPPRSTVERKFISSPVAKWFEERHPGLYMVAPGLRGLQGVNRSVRLPDGSRWVDAEALRLVALHVLGGAS